VLAVREDLDSVEVPSCVLKFGTITIYPLVKAMPPAGMRMACRRDVPPDSNSVA
jgi:hypothetical protein